MQLQWYSWIMHVFFSSEVLIFHAHYCECTIFIIGAYYHHWGSNSQAPKMMFSQGLETMGHGAYSKVLTNYTTSSYRFILKQHTNKHNLFQSPFDHFNTCLTCYWLLYYLSRQSFNLYPINAPFCQEYWQLVGSWPLDWY